MFAAVCNNNFDLAGYDFCRLFGLTAVIFTDCEYPNQLLLHSGVEYPYYVNPFLLLLLYLLLATDMRFWINTPVSSIKIYWSIDR